MKEDLEQKEKAIKGFREKEISLRREKQKLEEDKENFQLEQQRKLDEAKKEIEKKITYSVSEKFKYKEDEYKKKLDDALAANASLARKLEQGSQQLQGEVLEIALEKLLHDSFPYDDVKAIAKGSRGADVSQCVCTQNGQICGTIIWEAKRAQNWSDKWLQKLKDDCMVEKADIAVLVSTTLPKDCNDSFKIYDGVWVISDKVIRPVAETLRVILIESNKLKIANKGKAGKAELVYEYLCSPNFTQNVRSVIQAFVQMKTDLDREKMAMNKTWKKRESQLERVTIGMSTMVGELQAVAQNSLLQLDKIEQLSLPGENEED